MVIAGWSANPLGVTLWQARNGDKVMAQPNANSGGSFGLGKASFGTVLAGIVVVGLGVEIVNAVNPKAALVLVIVILISIVVASKNVITNKGAADILAARLYDLQNLLFGG